jgi:hypothetical protein
MAPQISLTTSTPSTTETSVTINYVLSGFSFAGTTSMTAFVNNNTTIDDYRSVVADVTIDENGGSTGSIVVDTLVPDVEYSVLVRVLNVFQSISVVSTKKLLDAPTLTIGEMNGGVTKFSGDDGSMEITVSWTPLTNDDPSYIPNTILILWKTLKQSIQYVSFDVDPSNIVVDGSNNVVDGSTNVVTCSYIVKLVDLPTDEFLEISGMLTNDYGDSPLSTPVTKVLVPSVLDSVQNLVLTQNIENKKLLVEFSYPSNQFEQVSDNQYKFADTQFVVKVTFDDYDIESTIVKRINGETDPDETMSAEFDLTALLTYAKTNFTGYAYGTINVAVESISNDYTADVDLTNTATSNLTIQTLFGDAAIAPTSTVSLAYNGANIDATVTLNFATALDQLQFLTVLSSPTPGTVTTESLNVNITATYDDDETKHITQSVDTSKSTLSTTFTFSNGSFGVNDFFSNKVSFSLTTSVNTSNGTFTNPTAPLNTGTEISLKPVLASVTPELTGNIATGNPTGFAGNLTWSLYGQSVSSAVSKLELAVTAGSSTNQNYYGAASQAASITESSFSATKLPDDVAFTLGRNYTFTVFLTYTDTTTAEKAASELQFGWPEYTFNITDIFNLQELNNSISINVSNAASSVVTPADPQYPLSNGALTVKVWIKTSTIDTAVDSPYYNGGVPQSGIIQLTDLTNGTTYNILSQIVLTFTNGTNVRTFTSANIIMSGIPRTNLAIVGSTTGPTWNGTQTTFSVVVNTNGLNLTGYQYLGIPYEQPDSSVDLTGALVKGTSFTGISSATSGANLTLTFTSQIKLESVILFLTGSLAASSDSESNATVDSLLSLFNMPPQQLP